MNYFFDTSALVKYFHYEKGSDLVTKIIQAKANRIWVLELAGSEFLCTLHRWYRNNEIDEEELNVAITGFKAELKGFNVEPLNNRLVEKANELIEKFGKEVGLRSLDALHLAGFNLIADEQWRLVTADGTMERVGKLMGFSVVNPLT